MPVRQGEAQSVPESSKTAPKSGKASRADVTLICLILLAFLLIPSSATAQVFSPGELASVHRELDTMKSCDECHAGQNKIDRKRCLKCHRPIETRLRRRKGFHGQSRVRGKACETCHTEHKGRGASIIKWPGGRQERFGHRQTSWPLEEAHAKLKCAKCHENLRIEADDVKTYLSKNPGTETFLGLDRVCDACHFDEHRGSLKGKCDTCHDTKKWKPAPKFEHEKVWKLEQAHAKVKCEKCHKPVQDSAFDASAYPKPRAATFAKMKPLEHKRCTDCHKDPHRRRFGNDCKSCHDLKSWKVAPSANRKKEIAFHAKTNFPLKGRHQAVPCAKCHPRQKNGKKLLRPIPHKECINCHPNAHPEIPIEGPDAMGCDDCHSLEGYVPAEYSLEEHQKSRYPLKDAHQTVACFECHEKTMGKTRAAEEAKRVPGYLAAQVLSTWHLRTDRKTYEACDVCHQTPHREQFKKKKCTDCHVGSSWKNSTDFDHDKKTEYKLEAKHREVACVFCHPQEKDQEGRFTRYRPIDTKDCVPCHEDPHYGQFRILRPVMTCKDCHQVKDFKELKFDHNKAEFSNWPLEGKHWRDGEPKCEKCHPEAKLADDVKARRYRPLPTRCEDCHEDIHEGRYREAANLVKESGGAVGAGGQLADAQVGESPTRSTDSTAAEATSGSTSGSASDIRSGSASDSATVETIVIPWRLPDEWFIHVQEDSTDCKTCHEPKGWDALRFDHGKTRFPLKGLHQQVVCTDCHRSGLAGSPSMDCADCHSDVHQGVLGANCRDCHSEEGFDRPFMALSRHARTSFPLIGKHAAVDCVECHQDVRGASFSLTPTDCFVCHEKDQPAPGSDELEHSSFSQDCSLCHSPAGWDAAHFLDHNRCFPINVGSHHWSFACTSCHRSGIPTPTGTCADSGVACTNCHGCQTSRHSNVNGYECADRKCYQCHPGGR